MKRKTLSKLTLPPDKMDIGCIYSRSLEYGQFSLFLQNVVLQL